MNLFDTNFLIATKALELGDDIRHKPIPRQSERRSYRAQVKAARRRRPNR